MILVTLPILEFKALTVIVFQATLMMALLYAKNVTLSVPNVSQFNISALSVLTLL